MSKQNWEFNKPGEKLKVTTKKIRENALGKKNYMNFNQKMFGHSVIIFFSNRRNEYFVIFAQVFFCFVLILTITVTCSLFFLIVMRENMAKIRVGGEINWWKSCSFCLLRFSKHKSISTAVLFCIIVGGGSRKVFLRSFFFSSRKAWKKMEFGWFFIGKYRGFFLWISSGCSSAFKVVHTSRGAEPWPNQPGTSSHSFLQLKKKIRHIYQVFTLVKNEINWCDSQLQKEGKIETSLYWINWIFIQ